MERQSPPKILQLNAVCTTLPFVLSTRYRAPRGTLGDYPLLSIYDEYHDHECVGERSRKQKISDLRTSPGPLWRLHTWFDLFRYRLVAQREIESMTIGGADPRS